jgi:hypothetical protein
VLKLDWSTDYVGAEIRDIFAKNDKSGQSQVRSADRSASSGMAAWCRSRTNREAAHQAERKRGDLCGWGWSCT